MNRIKLLCFFILAAVTGVFAQNVNTPYSMYGYGIMSDHATSMQRQMGSVGYAMSSGRQINVMNPASYAAIDSLTFLFDMGADLTLLWQKEGAVKKRTTGGGLDYLTMQFPLSKYMGASIGLLPYSSVGYAFGNEIKFGAMENQGSGGINQAYIGVAGKVKGFSVGFNVAYSFGNIVNDVYATPSTTGQSLTEHVMQIRDWDINLGVQYMAKVSRNDQLTIGLTYAPKKSLHGKTWVTTQEMSQTTSLDTVAYMNMAGKYYTPSSFGAGISYKHERTSYWMVEADVTLQQWSKAKYSPLYKKNAEHTSDNIAFRGMKFDNRIRYALGGEYIPNIRGNYLQRVPIRLGGYYTEDYLNINGNQVREYGVTCGFGFNAPEGKTMINLGLEWKRRMAHPRQLIAENYFNITLGINFNEHWFWQRKIR